ncbi:MAG TPA: hypothetical protein VIW93_05625, partial [Candidatus Acidoferrum sp.]
KSRRLKFSIGFMFFTLTTLCSTAHNREMLVLRRQRAKLPQNLPLLVSKDMTPAKFTRGGFGRDCT